MSITLEEVTMKRSQEVEKERKTEIDPLLRFIFEKPVYTVEKTTSAIALSIHETSVRIEKIEKTVIEERVESILGTRLKTEGNTEPVKSFPKWKYYTVESAPHIEDIVILMANYLKGLTSATTLESYKDLTRQNLLQEPFKVADQLLSVVRKTKSVKSVYLVNDAGGVDIVSKVESLSGADREYPVVISIREENQRPVIYTYCSCPIHKKDLFCKHVMTVLASRPHVVLAAIDYIADGRKNPLDHYLDYWKDKTDELAKTLNTAPEEVYAGFIYYFNKFLLKRGLVQAVHLPPEHEVELSEIASHMLSGNDILSLEGAAIVRKREEKPVPTTERVSDLLKIQWPEKMDEMRKQVLEVIKELTARFGVVSEEQAEWPLLMTYAMVMSADYTKPPVVIHVVGDIGTFKTTGARLISEYLVIPELVFTYRGPDTTDKYYKFLELLSKDFGFPISLLENRIGGVITQVRTLSNGLTIGVSLPYLFSAVRDSPDGLEKIKKFVAEAKSLGFDVQERRSKPKVAIIDTAQLSNIEDYRMKYLPDERLGLLTVMDVFDNYVLVIDEGSRNPHGLETLLTKMSISSTIEGVRIIVVTDNIEPFQEVISNPRYAPLHDRAYKAMTKAIKDDQVVMENLYKPPKYAFDVVKLIAVQKFVESIPVPEGIMYLVRAVGNALEFKYTIDSAKPGVKHLRPIRRNERAPIELDVFGGQDFKFIFGGRFTNHTITLAKFIAFLNGHDHVTLDDLKTALLVTVKSRLVVNAESYADYKIKVLDIVSRIYDALANGEELIKRVVDFIHLLRTGADKTRLEKEFAAIISDANINPMLAPAVMSALELVLSIYKIDLGKLPDNLKYSIIELKIEKDDFTGLEKYMDDVKVIMKARQTVVKP